MERIVLQRHFHNGILVRSIGLAALKFPTYRDTKQGSASSGSSVGVLVLVPDLLTVREASILGDDAKEAYLYTTYIKSSMFSIHFISPGMGRIQWELLKDPLQSCRVDRAPHG